MKILFVGVFNENSTNYSQSQRLKDLGHEVIQFSYRAEAEKDGLFARDTKIINTCMQELPDVVLFSKANTISSRVVSICNKFSKTFLWYMDPLNENYNDELINKIKLCTGTICSSIGPFEESKKYSDNVYFLFEGYDEDVDKPHNLEKDIDVSFIGTIREKRADYYSKIGFQNFNNVFREEHAKIVSRSKINLNFSNQGGASDRVFKVLAAGGFLLTDDWPGREEMFNNEEDLVLFKDPEDLKNKIDYFLHSEWLRERIARSGHISNKKYSRAEWARKITEEIFKND